MTNTFKKSFLILAACFVVSTIGAQTTVTWTPTEADVTALTNTSVHVITIGAGTQSFQVYSTRPFFNNNQVKLEWDASANAIKMTDNGIDKAGLAIYIPANSDDVQQITVYMHTTGSRKTLYANGKTCPNSGTSTTSAIAKTPTAYNFWSAPFQKDWYYAFGGRKDGSGDSYYDKIEVVFAGPAGPVYVTGVTLNKTTISIVAGQTEQLTATVQPANADDTSVSWSSSDTNVATVDQNGNISALAEGQATITVTTTDGSKTATCTVTVTAPPTPKDVTGIGLSETTATVYVGATKSLTVNYTPADANQGLGITWTSSNENIATVADGVVTGVAAGTATITATSTGGFTATCNVTVQTVAVTGVSLNKHALSLKIGQSETLVATVAPATATNKNVTWSSSNPLIASVTSTGNVTGVAVGSTQITVTTADGNKTDICAVNITDGELVPATDLTLHEPGVYDEKAPAGYGASLTNYNQHEYETYFFSYKSNLVYLGLGGSYTTNSTVPLLPGIDGVSAGNLKSDDGWLAISAGKYSGSNTSPKDEFAVSDAANSTHYAEITSSGTFSIHIKGYDQFSFSGRDNSASDANKQFVVTINDETKTITHSATDWTIWRFDLNPRQEYVIKVSGKGSDANRLRAFSLRVPQEPRTKWLRGNDSTQVVNQTASITPITYVTKYNNIQGAETALVWDGPDAKGISLTKHEGELSDTLILSGQANCQIGEYNYHIAAYYNSVEINRVSGKFTVNSSIAARSELDVVAYTGEDMDQIIFSYYALSPDSVQLRWLNGEPTGISGSGSKGKYIIGGTPTVSTGTYPYSITTVGGDTTFYGTISVITPNYGPKSVMYLCKNVKDFNRDAVYQALNGTGSNQWELIPRKQKEDGSRPANQYANYQWILISEDADADNLEVLDVLQGAANLPVLNMKGFTYSQGRLGWGDPDNGAIDTTQNTKNKGTKLYIEQPTHPIFAQMGGSLKKGDSIQILSNYESNGLMPININLLGTYCLATAYTRNINDYYKNGELQTVLHEVPADMRNGNKYICLPMAKGVTLTQQGKNLLNGIVSYLLSSEQAIIELPELKIESFELLGVQATIDQRNNTISVALSIEQSEQLEGAEPTIKIADEVNTHVTTSSVPLKYALYTPKTYVVTDYINRRAYSLTIDVYDPEGIENVYEAGEWVNIFDIYGRKVATTNENIYTMDLPRGMYIIVTESGETLKIMR